MKKEAKTSIQKEVLQVREKYQEMKEAYLRSESWEDVVTCKGFNSEEDINMEAFIELVEEVYKTKIEEPEELEKLIGLKALLSKEENIVKSKEPTLEYILTAARFNKYFTALQLALENGATYKDLQEITPEDYGLKSDYKRDHIVGKDKQNAILWAISFVFFLNESPTNVIFPSPRKAAEEIEAPYSVIMEAYKLTR